jgi:hypothetical protein
MEMRVPAESKGCVDQRLPAIGELKAENFQEQQSAQWTQGIPDVSTTQRTLPSYTFSLLREKTFNLIIGMPWLSLA